MGVIHIQILGRRSHQRNGHRWCTGVWYQLRSVKSSVGLGTILLKTNDDDASSTDKCGSSTSAPWLIIERGFHFLSLDLIAQLVFESLLALQKCKTSFGACYDYEFVTSFGVLVYGPRTVIFM